MWYQDVFVFRLAWLVVCVLVGVVVGQGHLAELLVSVLVWVVVGPMQWENIKNDANCRYKKGWLLENPNKIQPYLAFDNHRRMNDFGVKHLLRTGTGNGSGCFLLFFAWKLSVRTLQQSSLSPHMPGNIHFIPTFWTFKVSVDSFSVYYITDSPLFSAEK